MRFVADHELVGVAAERVDVAREPGVRLNREWVRAQRLLAALDRRCEAVAVTLCGQVVRELGDEQAPVREDEDAERSRGVDEAGCGDGLARRGRMTEAVAPDRTGILFRRQLRLFVVLVLGVGERLVLVLLVDDLLDGVPVAVAVFLLALRRGDQLGEHARQGVDLVPPQRRAGCRVRLRVGEHALEPEHQPVVHLPLRARPGLAGVQLGDRVVERSTACSPWRERLLDLFAVMEEWLARPRLGAVCGGGKRVRRLGEGGRLNGFLHVRSTSIVLQTSKGARSGVPWSSGAERKHTLGSGDVNPATEAVRLRGPCPSGRRCRGSSAPGARRAPG